MIPSFALLAVTLAVAPPAELEVRVLPADRLDADSRAAWQTIRGGSTAFAGPYFHPGFAEAVAAVRDDVFVAVFSRDGEPVGFFPHQRDARGRGKPVGGPLSDFHGVVSAEPLGLDGGRLLAACGLRGFAFDHLVVGTEPAFTSGIAATAESRFLDLSDGFDAWFARVHKTRGSDVRDLGRKRRVLAREVGAVTFRRCGPDDEAFDALLRWKSEQYLRTGFTDVFGVAWTEALLRRLVANEGDGPAGDLTALYAGENLVAVHCGMRDGAVLHYWFPAYDRAFAKYSPGSLLLVEAARHGAADGLTRIDLGKGDERYKRAFGDGVDRVAEGLISASGWEGSSAKALSAGKRWVKRSPLCAPVRYSARLLKPWRERNRFG